MELDSAIAKLPDCDKREVIHALIGIVNGIMMAKVGDDIAASNRNNKVEEKLTLKDRLTLTLAIEDLFKKYSKEAVRRAIIDIIDNMVRGNGKIKMRGSNDEMLGE